MKTADFKAGLRALNASAQTAHGRGGPLSEDQLELLIDFVDADHDGNIDYQVPAWPRPARAAALRRK